MSFLATLERPTNTHNTTIQGVSYPLPELSAAAWFELMKPSRQPPDNITDADLVNLTCEVVIKCFEGLDTEVTPAMIVVLHEKISNGDMVEYVQRLCALNDYGLGVLEASEKNSETIRSNATE